MGKYQIWHDQIIDRAKHRMGSGAYVESHHIVPRSLGGTDDPANLVNLTYREHYLIHWILTKMHVGTARSKMVFAFYAMSLPFSSRSFIASWRVERAKRVLKDQTLKHAKERRDCNLSSLQKDRLSIVRTGIIAHDRAAGLNLSSNSNRIEAQKLANALLKADPLRVASMGTPSRKSRYKAKAGRKPALDLMKKFAETGYL